MARGGILLFELHSLAELHQDEQDFGIAFITVMTVTLDSALSRKDRDRRDDRE